MRLQIKIRPKRSYPYENDYHYHLQSSIYALIREGGLPDVHEKKGYKFFCFSNIYPFGDFRTGIEKNLLVSSPDPEIIESIWTALRDRMGSADGLLVGDLAFSVSGASNPFLLDLRRREMIARSATPIVMRIPKRKYEAYGIKPKVDYDYVFWRESIPFEAFINQLRDNIAKKANEFLEKDEAARDGRISLRSEVLLPTVTSYKFIRSVAKPIVVKGDKQLIIGSIWDITFRADTDDQMGVLNIALDSGLGERNSLGFGFVNVSGAADQAFDTTTTTGSAGGRQRS